MNATASQRTYAQQFRARMKQARWCIECVKAPATSNRLRCQACGVKNSQRAMRWRRALQHRRYRLLLAEYGL